MYQQQVQFIINFLMLLDALCAIGSVYLAADLTWLLHHYDVNTESVDSSYLALFLVFANNFILGQMGLYSDKRALKFTHTVRDSLASVLLLFMLLSAFLIALKISVSRSFIILCAGFMSLLLIFSRAMLELYLNRQEKAGFSSHRVLLVGNRERVRAVAQALEVQSSWGHKVVGYLHESENRPDEPGTPRFLGTIEALHKTLPEQNIDEVVFAISSECANIDIRKCIDYCEELGTTYRIVPALYDPRDSYGLRVEEIQGIPTLLRNTVSINCSGMLYKSVLDYLVGSVGFFIFLLMYPVVGLLIKLDSPGPVLFRQPRVGQHGRVFQIYKFRTMCLDAEAKKAELAAQNEMNGHMFKLACDPRVTKVGNFLRKTSLDEFPQFINVMKGEMSIVGTRPPTQDEVRRYEARHRKRLALKPGITGLWQISGRNKITDFEQVLKLDLQYIDNWRFFDDIRIILKTIQVVLLRKGAW